MKLICLVITISAIIIQMSIQVPLSIHRIVVDVDAGADDAFALLVLLHAEKMGRLKVEAILCSMGNSDLYNVCKNVIGVLEALNRTDIPVYKGAHRSILPIPDGLPKRFFFGRDGFGDLKYNSEPNLSIIKEIPGVIAIHDLVVNNPNEISLFCFGPLSTPALAMLLFEDFAANLRHIWIMGGNIDAEGNITDQAEFNFFLDPESAHIVIHNGRCYVTIVTWDTCIQEEISLIWRFNVLGNQNSTFMDLLNKVERNVYKNKKPNSHWGSCDVFAAITGAFQETILAESSQEASVVLHDIYPRGKLLVEVPNQNSTNVVLIEKIDVETVKKILLEAAADV